jgi:hypothetical protein
MKKQISELQAIIGALFLSLIVISCEKTTFNTKPSLKFISAGSYDVSQGQFLSFDLKVTDKEGDISDTIWIWSFVRNRVCPGPNPFPPFPYQIPDVPEKSNLDAEINITYIVGVTDPSAPIWNVNLCRGITDTTTFQFWMKDKAGNLSDTIEIDRPVLLRNN